MKRILALTLGICFCLGGAAWATMVTVSKTGPSSFTTIQAGIGGAGVAGTVTVLDSSTYVEDVTIKMAAAGVTIRAAPGQRPTIRALNHRTDAIYLALGIGADPTKPYDHMGVSVQAPCALVGLNIENTSTTTNFTPAFGGGTYLTACAIAIHSPSVLVLDCRMSGPTGGFPSGGDWATALVIAWGGTAANATFEGCTITGGEYGLINETFGRSIPSFTTSTLAASNCTISSATTSNVTLDAGYAMLTTCTIRNGQSNGVSCGGGRASLVGCDIVDNANCGLELDYNDSFALTGDQPIVTATDCLIARNRGSGQDGNVRIGDGRLTLTRCIIALPQNTQAIFMDDNNPGSPELPTSCTLDMNFCDIYSPGHDCFSFDLDVMQHPIRVAVKNTIMVGRNGLLMRNPSFNPCSIRYSDLFVTDTATSGVTTSNNVTIAPQYLLDYYPSWSGRRDGYFYYNENLNVGEAGAFIGSRGLYPGPAATRRWARYE